MFLLAPCLFFSVPSFILSKMPRSSGSRSRGAPPRITGLPESAESTSLSLEGDTAEASNPSVVTPHPSSSSAHLQDPLIKTLQDALEETRSVHRRAEAHQRKREQLQARTQVLREMEERKTAEIADLRINIVDLEAKLLGIQQPDAASRTPLTTEI